jgi:adenosylhomocysteine nucleosidase
MLRLRFMGCKSMLGILCGLKSEKRIASKVRGAIVACAAARPHKARDLARELVAMGATRLMSFGIAGSLDSSVNLGDVFIGTRVASAAGQWTCDGAWGRELANSIPSAKRGGVYGSEVLVATIEEKDALNQNTGCAIVDMESQCAAEVATEAGLPLMVVRAVCDDSVMNVPPFVMAAITEDGSVSVLRALGYLALHPDQTSDLFKVICGTSKALETLRTVRGSLGSL